MAAVNVNIFLKDSLCLLVPCGLSGTCRVWTLFLYFLMMLMATSIVQLNEVRTANSNLIPIGKTTPENDQEEYEPDAEDEEGDNAEEEGEGKFSQLC